MKVTQDRTPPSLLELRQLRALVALVEHGSVTAAARAIGLAQSTVSEALAALERALGTAVLQRGRGTHAGRLTAAGQAFLPHAREVLAKVTEAHIAVAGATNSARAAVDIVANESVSTYVLPGVLSQVRDRWPNTQFSVSVATCAGVRQGLDEGVFDVGFLLEAATRRTSTGQTTPRSTRVADREVVAPDVSLVVFAAPSHVLVRGTPPAPVPRSALAAVPLFMSDSAGDFHALVERFFDGEGVHGPRLQVTGSVEGVKRGVIADPRALGVLPSYAIVEELRAGRVVRLELRPTPPPMRLEALLSRSRARHPSIEELIQGVRRAFGADARPRGVGRKRSV